MSDLDWVPASCTLPTEQQPLRLAEWDDLFAQHLEQVSRPEALRIRLDLRGGERLEKQVRHLADQEGDCCSFFTFAVIAEQDAVRLDITVDAAHTTVLDAVELRAGELRAGAVGQPR